MEIADTNRDENYMARNRFCVLELARMIYVGRSLHHQAGILMCCSVHELLQYDSLLCERDRVHG